MKYVSLSYLTIFFFVVLLSLVLGRYRESWVRFLCWFIIAIFFGFGIIGPDDSEYLRIHTEGSTSNQSDLAILQWTYSLLAFVGFTEAHKAGKMVYIAIGAIFISLFTKNVCKRNQLTIEIVSCLALLSTVLADRPRNFVAISIFAFASKYIRDKSFRKYAIALFSGSLFHSSIILLLPMYMVAFMSSRAKYRITVVLTTIIALYISYTGLLATTAQQYLLLIPFYGFKYSDTVFAMGSESVSNLSVIIPAILLSFIFLRSKSSLYICWLALSGLVIATASSGIPLALRMSEYFSLFAIGTLDLTKDIVRKPNSQCLVFYLLIGFYLIRTVLILETGSYSLGW